MLGRCSLGNAREEAGIGDEGPQEVRAGEAEALGGGESRDRDRTRTRTDAGSGIEPGIGTEPETETGSGKGRGQTGPAGAGEALVWRWDRVCRDGFGDRRLGDIWLGDRATQPRPKCRGASGWCLVPGAGVWCPASSNPVLGTSRVVGGWAEASRWPADRRARGNSRRLLMELCEGLDGSSGDGLVAVRTLIEPGSCRQFRWCGCAPKCRATDGVTDRRSWSAVALAGE
jgi:hypothetical protein